MSARVETLGGQRQAGIQAVEDTPSCGQRRSDVGGQAEAAAELVPDDELVDFPFEEEPDDDDPSPVVELDFFSAGLAELDDESLELAAADFDGSDLVDDSESDDECLPAALRLSLR
jgi:hypothetical protein